MNCSMVEKKVVSKSLMLSFNCKVGLTVLTHRAVTDAHRYEQAVTSLRKHLRGLTCYCLWSLLWLLPPQSYPLSQNRNCRILLFTWWPLKTGEKKAIKARSIRNPGPQLCVFWSLYLSLAWWHVILSLLTLRRPLAKGVTAQSAKAWSPGSEPGSNWLCHFGQAQQPLWASACQGRGWTGVQASLPPAERGCPCPAGSLPGWFWMRKRTDDDYGNRMLRWEAFFKLFTKWGNDQGGPNHFKSEELTGGPSSSWEDGWIAEKHEHPRQTTMKITQKKCLWMLLLLLFFKLQPTTQNCKVAEREESRLTRR